MGKRLTRLSQQKRKKNILLFTAALAVLSAAAVVFYATRHAAAENPAAVEPSPSLLIESPAPPSPSPEPSPVPCVCDVAGAVVVGLGTDADTISAADFIKDACDGKETLFSSDLSAIDFDVLGEHAILLTIGGEGWWSVLEVRDLVPPEATPVHVERFISDEPLDPNDFIIDIIDQTSVAVSFYTEPDDRLEGVQEVFILLEDESGNTTVVTSLLTLIRDTEPPVISGALDKSVFVGDTIAYRAGILLRDNRDKEVTLTVDSSAVNLRVEGVYTVIYTATDSSGNKATARGTVTVHSVTREQVDEMADGILTNLLTPDMTPREQIRAIYDWVRGHVNYSKGGIKDNVAFAAYRGLKYGTGDCYVYYATAEVLLTRAGINNLPIQNIETAVTRHYWSLVNLGDGWYHYDTTPHESNVNGFMITESEAQRPVPNRSRTYYTYDKSLYPTVVP
jgi:transglutaminase-like putative cysteine protease